MGAIYVGKKLGAAGFEMEVVLKQLLPEFTQQEEFIDLFSSINSAFDVQCGSRVRLLIS